MTNQHYVIINVRLGNKLGDVGHMNLTLRSASGELTTYGHTKDTAVNDGGGGSSPGNPGMVPKAFAGLALCTPPITMRWA